ncbi:cytochrome P450 2U1-like [Asterias rubens]|uniref:cytochrome P450 2U1-like n=1 Tax=Asterias rubens TaxID=7604 RepID=UPI0014550F7D|nr:cytochrome P450 2U1-like [Asterias rubens]
MAIFQIWAILKSLGRFLDGRFVSLVLAILALALLKYRSRTSKRMPNGPLGLPFIGYIPFMGRKPYLTFVRLARRYGSIFSVRLGTKLVVVLNGRKAIREAFVTKGQSFAGRPDWVLNRVNQGKGIANQQANQLWRDHRRFVLSVMRSFGEGRTQMENKVTEEVSHFVAELASHDGSPIDMTYLVQLTFSNIICSVCFGQRYKPSNPDFKHLLHMADVFFKHLTSASAVNFFPLLWYIPLRGHLAVREMYTGISEFVSDRVQEHKSSLNHDSPRDLIDIYLSEIAKRDLSDSNNYSKVETGFTEDYIKHVVTDLFLGGTETVNAVVLWSFVCMVMYPDIQTRIQAEINEVVGSDRVPTMADKTHLPFTQATLLELHRRCNVIPCAIPHATTEDVELEDFILPKGTTVMANLYSSHMDPEYWQDPDRFDPTRFLDTNGQLINHESYMPFSIGRRACLGEQLAKCEIFLAFTGVLQRFRLELPKGDPHPSLDGLPGITHLPRTTRLRAVPRK